ncbi:MAG TPA: hypothetical protein VM734_30715 [Kofleriaceae bacterium]|nr:hypothetical protein [Kofleriaceae bacterium]
MRTTHLLTSVVFAALVGCAFEPGEEVGGPGQDPGIDNPADVDAGVLPPPPPTIGAVCRVDRMKIGVVGLTVQVGAIVTSPVVTFTAWTADPARPDRFVGFTLSSEAAAMRYVVRVGDRDLEGRGLTFTIPAGSSGSGPGGGEITRVDFCVAVDD